MRCARAVQTVMSVVLAAPMTVFAHPGHVHQPGLVHGYSWFDLFGSVAVLAVPLTIALLAAAARGRDGRDD